MPAELLIYDIIGGGGYWWDDDVITGDRIAAFLKEDVPQSETELNIRINSPGGAVDEGVTIMNYINAWKNQRRTTQPEFKIRTIVDGFAYSAASVIFMAGDERIMNVGTTLMIHKAWSFFMANADEIEAHQKYLKKIDGELANVYKKFAGNTADYWLGLMKEETYFTPDEAVTAKLATVVDEESEAKPSEKHNNFSHMQPGAYGRTMTTVAMQRLKGLKNAERPKRGQDSESDPQDDTNRLLETDLLNLEYQRSELILSCL